MASGNMGEPVTPSTFVSPLPSGNFDFPLAQATIPWASEVYQEYDGESNVINIYKVEVYFNGNFVASKEYRIRYGSTSSLSSKYPYEARQDRQPLTYNWDTGILEGVTPLSLYLGSGIYNVKYSYCTLRNTFIDDYDSTPNVVSDCQYTFYVVENRYPLKKKSIGEVIDRVFRLIEPLVAEKNGDGAQLVKEPRFLFGYKYPVDTEAGKEERAIFAKTSPEFTFTRSTLREQLQEIGKYIHAEPRLIKRVIDGKERYVFIYDRYGEQELATYKRNSDGAIVPFHQHPYASKILAHDIDVACTSVESDVDNFVNRLDKTGGTITEPYRGGAKTLRTDQSSLRFEDSEGSAYFPTSRGIMYVSGTSFYWIDFDGDAGTPGARYDITPYVFEKTAYDAELSSYDDSYPKSKCFALYYQQGQQGIHGFFFKNVGWSGGVYENYAILNILERVTNKKLKDKLIKKYPTLSFELTYTPMYGARVSHGKSYLGDVLKKPFSLMYNASSNVVETRYYGEHLKGVAERLGNVDKQITVKLRNAGNVPKIGQKWDDDYYVSTVKGSVVLGGIIVNIGLTKKFNRMSAYVGANSYKRYYEVSERMAQQRKMLYKDYLVITAKTNYSVPKDCAVSAAALTAVANTFYQGVGTLRQETMAGGSNIAMFSEIVNFVRSDGWSKSFKAAGASVFLPVTSSAFGNCMEFTWDFKDNYSAGISSVYRSTTNKDKKEVEGYFGAEVSYGDYYGKTYYQQWRIGVKSNTENITLERALALPNAFDGGLSPVLGLNEYGTDNLYHVVDKDNREVLSQAYAMEFVTDMKGVVIGSALSRNNPMIGGLITDKNGHACTASLYVLQEGLNQFATDEIDLTNATLVATFTSPGSAQRVIRMRLVRSSGDASDRVCRLECPGFASPVAGKAWAIITREYEGEPQTVEDEDGNVTTITPKYGKELLIGRNVDVSKDDYVGRFNILPAHDIFDFQKEAK